MAFKFFIGAVAQLKSGGPLMTVTKDKPEAGSKFVGVTFWEGNVLRTEVLPKEALQPDEATLKAFEKAEKEAAAAKAAGASAE